MYLLGILMHNIYFAFSGENTHEQQLIQAKILY